VGRQVFQNDYASVVTRLNLFNQTSSAAQIACWFACVYRE
jgi:hypothetical protein